MPIKFFKLSNLFTRVFQVFLSVCNTVLNVVECFFLLIGLTALTIEGIFESVSTLLRPDNKLVAFVLSPLRFLFNIGVYMLTMFVWFFGKVAVGIDAIQRICDNAESKIDQRCGV